MFLVALALRLLHLITVRDSPFFSVLYIDPLWYDEWARGIAAGHLVGERPFFLDPLYPYFLAAIFAAFGHSYTAVAATQGLLGACIAPLTLLAARPWFPRATARLAGTIAAVYLPALYFGGILMKPGLSLFLVSLTLWFLSRALAGTKTTPYLAAGIAVGLTSLTRGNLILVLPVLAAWLLLRAGQGRPHWRQAAIFSAGAALVLAIPAAHNYAVGGEFILSTANSGANFYIGNNPDNHSGEYQQLPFVNANPKYEQRDFAREAERRAGRPLSDREVSAFWFGEGLRWIRGQPGAWLLLMGRKAWSFWGAFEIPDSLDYYLYRETAPVLRLPLPGFGLLAPLALLGAVLVRTRRDWPRLLLIFSAAYSMSVILFFVFSRFRMVLAPALYVLAAHAAIELATRWRDREVSRAVWPTALFAALFLFVNVPVRAHADAWSHRVARLLALPVRTETSALGAFNLGTEYAALAKDQDESPELLALAEKELRRAMELQGAPVHARIHVELGKILARQRRNREAIALYERAAAIETGDYRIPHALGLLHRREGEAEQAAAAFARALVLEPRHVASADRLGETLLEIGRRDEAERAFRHALQLSPDDPSALAGLRALGVERERR